MSAINHWQQHLPDYINVCVRQVKWARIQVQASGEVQFVVPRRYDVSDVMAMYASKQHWIDEKRRKILSREVKLIELRSDEILLFGQGFRVYLDPCQKSLARVDHETKAVYFAKDLRQSEQRQRWYRDFAKQYLSCRITQLAEQQGFQFNRLFIREQKTRWGSCSSRGNISLNWKLLKAPIEVSDYVILHELAHTEIMNHSAAFWQRVESLVPDYKDAKLWLRNHGHQL
jgi:predicted metal-dependent hydrolase